MPANFPCREAVQWPAVWAAEISPAKVQALPSPLMPLTRGATNKQGRGLAPVVKHSDVVRYAVRCA